MLRVVVLGLISVGVARAAEPPPLLDESVISALAGEISGESAKRNLDVIAGHHRMRASQGFRDAAEFIAGRLRAYGLEDVEILHFPADGKTMYGTQKARPAWDVESAELWELAQANGGWSRIARVGHWESTPLSLAEDSERGSVTATLVDVGGGTEAKDYVGKDVRGKLVLVSSQPEDVQALAVERHGAAGIVSYAQNQRNAWSGDDPNLLRWGHLDSFARTPTFAFMVTLKQARAWQARLAAGDTVQLQAQVEASRHVGQYDIVTARIRGADPARADQEIAFSCHLDHPHPGANDNASGCVTILEVARSFSKLIREGRLPRPARSVRFIWPPEIEGSTILLNARPDLAGRIAAVVHMDMVGGAPGTKAVFRVTRSPASLPTFVNDVAEAFAEFVNEQSLAHASGESVRYPLVAPEGGKEPLLAQMREFTEGSDHEVYTDSAFRIPSIYLNDWPDRYIHTDRDVPANIDPTKLKRAGFIGAASAWYLANLDQAGIEGLSVLLDRHRLERTARMLGRRAAASPDEAAALTWFHWVYERGVVDSLELFVRLTSEHRSALRTTLQALAASHGGEGEPARATTGEGARIYRRNADPKGPMVVFGYDYLADHLGDERVRALELPTYQGSRADGAAYALEALNFVDGARTVQAIRDALSAEFGSVPVGHVAEYLQALEEIGVLRRE